MKHPLRLGLVSVLLALPLAGFAQSAAITRDDFVMNMMASKALYVTGGNCFPDVTNQAFAPAVLSVRDTHRFAGSVKCRNVGKVTTKDGETFVITVEKEAA